jgi:DNA-directed RNA polymerase specialized sigma24 family protein
MEYSPKVIQREKEKRVDRSEIPLSGSAGDSDHYWYTDDLKKQNERLSRIREKKPGLLRRLLLKCPHGLKSMREESLLHLIDIYNIDRDDDVIDTLFKVLCKKCEPKILFMVKGMPQARRQDILEKIIEELGNAVIYINKKTYRFARFQFNTFLQRRVIDAVRKSFRDSKRTIMFADIESLIEKGENEEPVFPDNASISRERQIISKEALDEILKQTNLPERKIEAYLLKEIEGLEDEEIAPIYKRTPDTIRKWRNTVERHLKRFRCDP